MKRFLCMVIALVLCLSASAMAEPTLSKTTLDLIKFDVTAENLPEGAELYLFPVNEPTVGEMLPDYQERIDICQIEIDKLADSDTIDHYFGNILDIDGNVVTLEELLELLETEELHVFEFCPAIAGGYQEVYGNVTATMLFSTPYEEGEKVIVLIGVVTLLEDEEQTAEQTEQNVEQTVQWYAFEGIGLEAIEGQEETEGRVQVVLPPEIVEAIQNDIALLAVVSKDEISTEGISMDGISVQ